MSLDSADIHVYLGTAPAGRSAHFAQDIPETSSTATPLLCSEEGGDTTGNDTTTQRVQPDRGEASEGIGSNDTTTETTSDNQPQVKADEEGPQELNQGYVPEQNEQKTVREATPVASRTRAGKQATSKKIDNNTKRCEDKESIRQLTRRSRNNKTSLMR